MTKKCNKCKKTKNVSEFYIRRARRRMAKDGYRYICKLCDNKVSNARRKKNGYIYEQKRQGPGSNHSKRSKINSQRHRDEMSDMYIRGLICKKSKNLKPKDISNELIEVWRTSLALKRALRNS
tara:strand:+ start:151 stop:519 length:369 start_codon:yes stop_codon:yes gene_type:complete